ncbi:long-chain fatty acid--CoA ligase [Vitiosangium sp. GDMCC 1.1324]|uniref:AMP-dependent synthetase/ligase n=1 Tax=Vitiosangium sp. (strain GDMCC 1.1324) TaxID=2138576 RepID=UPI000D39E52D|nr:long-chain fatty acid--CoA ligase [Vitiosangium sp. GDMCC 1.1324]PTL78221.1 long-chain fatty acid--CoA ligase [Vitiosangium sp. GDMCC 1.1324]
MRAETQLATPSASARNLVALLLERAQSPTKVAASWKTGGRWEDVTWGRILEDVQVLSAGLIAQGVKPGERVAVFADTSLQYVVCDLAISAAQAITVPIYASNTPDEVRYILNHSGASLVFVDHDAQTPKQPGRATRLRQKLAACPGVRQVVLFEGPAMGDAELTLADLMARGREAHAARPESFDERVRAMGPEDVCSILYTSGTTGDPKGVLLTHGNWSYEALGVKSRSLMLPGDAVMMFLPLAHSFGQVVKAAWLAMGFRMVFAESTDKLMENLMETRPSILPAVPRVFEKVFSKVVADGSAEPGVKGRLVRWAFALFDEYVEARNQGRAPPQVGMALARKLVFSKVRAKLDTKLGGNMRLFISGGAPLSKKIAWFFDLLGYTVVEGYGLTETSAATFVNPPEKVKIGTVGPPLPGTEVKIAQDGEILIRGPGVMKGYYQSPEATAEVLEADGWFHSGDIGEVDADSYLRITDRKKDIIVTSGGKNVAPQNIENSLKTFPLISQAVVHGDQRKYLVALITVAEEPARKLLAGKGVVPGSYEELCRRPELQAAVQEIVDKVNAELPSYSTLKRFAVMKADFSQESGELTPSLKVKRKHVSQKFKAVLDGLYEHDGQAN